MASATVDRGHSVVVFFNAEGVRHLMAASGPAWIAPLIGKGVRMMACRTSVMECGFETGKMLASGAEMSSLSELIELMEWSNRTIFLG